MGLFFPILLQEFWTLVPNLKLNRQDGSARDLPATPVVQHQVQPAEDREDPGGRLTFQYLKKRPSVPKCPMTGLALKGVKPSRPADRSRLSLRQKKVYRAYGGVLSHVAVREKIVRAFLIEEQKIVAKVLKNQGK